MGEDIVKRQNELRDPVSFKQEYLSRLPAGTGFYHPLPRIKEDPILPTDLDRTALNRYDNQSINGMFTRIVLFGAVAGVEAIVADFNGQTLQKPHFSDDFIDDLGLRKPSDKDYVEGMRPITYGTVIDHICRGEDPKQIWAQLERVMDVMNFYGRVFIGVSQSQAAVGIYKGMIFIPDIRLGEKQRKKLAAVTPCTLNDIGQDGIHKYRLNMPPRVYGFDEISCRNPSCISYPDHKEGAPAEFHRDRNNKFVCMYCERPHTFKEIWG
jgi:aspartate carbamoyltransferase